MERELIAEWDVPACKHHSDADDFTDDERGRGLHTLCSLYNGGEGGGIGFFLFRGSFFNYGDRCCRRATMFDESGDESSTAGRHP